VQKIVAMLRLMRPANIITAVSDILAGIAIAGYFKEDYVSLFPVILLVFSTVGLYGGGVVFNDVFDAELDSVERPERPIPRGAVTKNEAGLLGIVLLLAGIMAAGRVHTVFFEACTWLAIAIAISALIYDRWGKHSTLLGPLNMGVCRGLNLLLGISIIPAALTQFWYLGLVPVVYIAAITMISRDEVHGGKKNTLYFALFLYSIVAGIILGIGVWNKNWVLTSVCLIVFLIMVLIPLFRAMQNPSGPMIGKAVKAGVIALIVMNASWAAAFGLPLIVLLIFALLPVSLILAKLFAVT